MVDSTSFSATISKSRFGFGYQYRYAVLLVLENLLNLEEPRRLTGIYLDWPIPNSSKSVDIKLVFTNPETTLFYECKTGCSFKGDEGKIRKFFQSFYELHNSQNEANAEYILIYLPPLVSPLSLYWDYICQIKWRQQPNVLKSLVALCFPRSDNSERVEAMLVFLRKMEFIQGLEDQAQHSTLESRIYSCLQKFFSYLVLSDFDSVRLVKMLFSELFLVVHKGGEQNKNVYGEFVDTLCSFFARIQAVSDYMKDSVPSTQKIRGYEQEVRTALKLNLADIGPPVPIESFGPREGVVGI